MNLNEGPEFDPDQTILASAPTPQGGAPGALFGVAVAQSAADPAPPRPPARLPALRAQPGHGLNPLVRAAQPLLDLVMPLRSMPSHPDVEHLRQQLVLAIKQFETTARQDQVAYEAMAAGRFAVCTLLDEAISCTPWGGGGVWASRSLLVAFHNEASGGEKFFLILQTLTQDVSANLPVLELLYLCLALGLEGRYRVIENGRSQLELLRERLQQLIQTQRGIAEPALSPHWRGASGAGKPVWRTVPLWVWAGGAALLCVCLQLGLSWRLTLASDPVFASLHAIKLLPPPTAPAVVAVAPRVATALADAIEQGLVQVRESTDRATVTLLGDDMFASGSAEVRPLYLPLLQRVAEALAPLPGKLLIIGHTDNIKSGISARFPSNWDLSLGRANAVKAVLLERVGPADRYTVEGRGETEPLVANDTALHRARNRRVDIVLLTPAFAP